MDKEEERRAKMRIQSALLKELETRNLSDYEDNDMAPTTEVHPIGHYIDDREEMIEQMFSVLHRDQIRALLPYELKEMSIEELKADCLVHLLGMSKKRIFAVLQGKELDSSSDSESDTSEVISIPDEIPDENNKIASSRGKVNEVSPVQDLITNDKDKTSRKKEKRKKKQSKKKSKKKSKKSDSDKKSLSRRKIVNLRAELQLTKNRKESIEKDAIEIIDSDEEEDQIDESEDDDDVTIVETSNKGTSLLELLELEMRARAIKAALMLDKEGSVGSILDMNNPVTIKQEKTDQVKKVDENKLKELKNTVCKQVDEDILLIEDVDIVELDNSDEEDVKKMDMLTDPIETEKLIEDKSENEKTTSNDDNNANNEWSDRWLQSKDVQNVVSKNKMCANLRRRMRFARLMKQKELEEKNLDETVESNVNIEGSVQEYMALLSKPDDTEEKENNDNDQSEENDSEKLVESEKSENDKNETEKTVEESNSIENFVVSNPDASTSSPSHVSDVLNTTEDNERQDNLLDPVNITDDIPLEIEDTFERETNKFETAVN